MWWLKAEHLPTFGQGGLELREARARASDHHQFTGLVRHDPRQFTGGDGLGLRGRGLHYAIAIEGFGSTAYRGQCRTGRTGGQYLLAQTIQNGLGHLKTGANQRMATDRHAHACARTPRSGARLGSTSLD